MPSRNRDPLTPPGGHEGHKPKNFRYLILGLIVMFLVGMGIMGTSTKIFHRPGPDQGAVEKAPAD